MCKKGGLQYSLSRLGAMKITYVLLEAFIMLNDLTLELSDESNNNWWHLDQVNVLNSSQLHVSLLGKLLQLMSFLEVEMDTGKFHAGGNPAMDWHPIEEE